MQDDKKKHCWFLIIFYFSRTIFFLHRHVFTFFANQQLKNIHSQLMSTNKDISYTWINSQTNATSGYTNGQLDIIMANFKNNPVLSQFYSWMNHPCIPSFTCFIMWPIFFFFISLKWQCFSGNLTFTFETTTLSSNPPIF